MRIGTGGFTYEWIEDWARVPETSSGNGRTHGVAVSQTGEVLVFHQTDAGDAVLVFDEAGKLKRSFGKGYAGAHGMTLVREGGEEFVWLTDEKSLKVAKHAVKDGREVQTIAAPPTEGKYIPTWVAVNPKNGDVWVADGYGSYFVHRYDKAGKYLGKIDGTSGAARLREPHGIAFTPAGELFIADRANHRVTVYDGEGKHLRSREGVCHSPCVFDFLGDLAVVPELFGSVKVIDTKSLDVRAELGANPDVGPHADPAQWWPPKAPQSWPNLRGTPLVKPGTFNSPHGACFAPNGDIYAVEWIVGGRITKLRKV